MIVFCYTISVKGGANLAKTKLTKEIELRFVEYLYDVKYELAILECTLGFRKRYGIVDILSYHGKSIANGKGKPRTREVTWRCYEIKTSKADFYSPHKWTFVGDYNYFVVPEILYDEIKQDIPEGVGCYVYDGTKYGFRIIKKSTRNKSKISESEIMHDFLVSNNRDARRWLKKTNTE